MKFNEKLLKSIENNRKAIEINIGRSRTQPPSSFNSFIENFSKVDCFLSINMQKMYKFCAKMIQNRAKMVQNRAKKCAGVTENGFHQHCGVMLSSRALARLDNITRCGKCNNKNYFFFGNGIVNVSRKGKHAVVDDEDW